MDFEIDVMLQSVDNKGCKALYMGGKLPKILLNCDAVSMLTHEQNYEIYFTLYRNVQTAQLKEYIGRMVRITGRRIEGRDRHYLCKSHLRVNFVMPC